MKLGTLIQLEGVAVIRDRNMMVGHSHHHVQTLDVVKIPLHFDQVVWVDPCCMKTSLQLKIVPIGFQTTSFVVQDDVDFYLV
jgi:hypothetical protein